MNISSRAIMSLSISTHSGTYLLHYPINLIETRYLNTVDKQPFRFDNVLFQPLLRLITNYEFLTLSLNLVRVVVS